MKENETRVTEKQQLIAAKTLCEEHAGIWYEHYEKLNGNREKCLIEIDRRRNEKTLSNMQSLWEIVEAKRNNADKNHIISKIILNVPGVWENNFPKLSRIAIYEKGNTVFYDEIDSEEGLEKMVDYLKIGATNKISLLLC